MPVESTNTISGLVATSPAGTDPVADGDNHLRLLKSVLKTQFTGGGSNIGLTAPVTVTAAEMNYLLGATSNLQAQINANKFAAGTSIIFCQVAPPVGWTQNVGYTDGMLRIVNDGTGTTGGGTDSIAAGITLAHTHTTGNFSLVEANMPAHTHFITKIAVGVGAVTNTTAIGSSTGSSGDANYDLKATATPANVGLSSSTGSGTSHNHGVTGSALANWSPKYINVIRCTKT